MSLPLNEQREPLHVGCHVVAVAILLAIVLGFVAIPAFVLPRMLESNRRDRELSIHRLMMDEVARIKEGKADGLHFYDVPNPDCVLAEIEPLDGLKIASFRQSPVTAAGIQSLIAQPNLRTFAFYGLDDGLVAAVASLPHLESLQLKYCLLSDAGVGTVVGISTLREIMLSNNDQSKESRCLLTDTTLDVLRSARQLKEIHLQGNWFSANAADRLRQARPDCRVDVESID
jgi:hypothetical protein